MSRFTMGWPLPLMKVLIQQLIFWFSWTRLQLFLPTVNILLCFKCSIQIVSCLFSHRTSHFSYVIVVFKNTECTYLKIIRSCQEQLLYVKKKWINKMLLAYIILRTLDILSPGCYSCRPRGLCSIFAVPSPSCGPWRLCRAFDILSSGCRPWGLSSALCTGASWSSLKMKDLLICLYMYSKEDMLT